MSMLTPLEMKRLIKSVYLKLLRDTGLVWTVGFVRTDRVSFELKLECGNMIAHTRPLLLDSSLGDVVSPISMDVNAAIFRWKT